MNISLHFAATLMATGILAAQEHSPPVVIKHSVAAKNSIEGLAPKDDFTYFVAICGINLSPAFKEGFTLGALSRRKGDRYWIQSIEADQSKEKLASEQLAIRSGYKLVVLSDFKNTEELRDQIAGFNMAMYDQMMIDQKKAVDR